MSPAFLYVTDTSLLRTVFFVPGVNFYGFHRADIGVDIISYSSPPKRQIQNVYTINEIGIFRAIAE